MRDILGMLICQNDVVVGGSPLMLGVVSLVSKETCVVRFPEAPRVGGERQMNPGDLCVIDRSRLKEVIPQHQLILDTLVEMTLN